MKFLDFKNKIQNMPVFSAKNISFLGQNEQVMRNQIRRWQDKGFLISLRRGLYLLCKEERKITPSRHFLANQIYGPSYVSLESALSFYGFIPERVLDVTSLTTRKTNTFKNEFGTFAYRHIKKECFVGFQAVGDEAGLSIFIALPEKAIVDFLYFNLNNFKNKDESIFKQGYRIQNVSGLNKKKLLELASLFNNRQLLETSNKFCEFMRQAND